VTTIAAAIGLGVAVLLAGSLPGAALAALNLRVWPQMPWALVPMAVYLGFYWAYIGGRLGSPGTAEARRTYLRAGPVAPGLWGVALATGLVGFSGLALLLLTMARLMVMPTSAPITTPAGMPALTGFLLVVMASVVAGVTEEAGFRGYMQGPVERRYGLLAAILVNGVMFGLLHFRNHPEAVLTMLPYYVAVAGVYGGLTWATDSILPAVALHAGGDVWSLTRLWVTGRPEWQLAGGVTPLVWTAGFDASFVMTAAGAVAVAFLFAVLCRTLYAMRLQASRYTLATSQSPAP
jgi:membrane protease YdiL (CAAX protease family)